MDGARARSHRASGRGDPGGLVAGVPVLRRRARASTQRPHGWLRQGATPGRGRGCPPPQYELRRKQRRSDELLPKPWARGDGRPRGRRLSYRPVPGESVGGVGGRGNTEAELALTRNGHGPTCCVLIVGLPAVNLHINKLLLGQSCMWYSFSQMLACAPVLRNQHGHRSQRSQIGPGC